MVGPDEPGHDDRARSFRRPERSSSRPHGSRLWQARQQAPRHAERRNRTPDARAIPTPPAAVPGRPFGKGSPNSLQENEQKKRRNQRSRLLFLHRPHPVPYLFGYLPGGFMIGNPPKTRTVASLLRRWRTPFFRHAQHRSEKLRLSSLRCNRSMMQRSTAAIACAPRLGRSKKNRPLCRLGRGSNHILIPRSCGRFGRCGAAGLVFWRLIRFHSPRTHRPFRRSNRE